MLITHYFKTPVSWLKVVFDEQFIYQASFVQPPQAPVNSGACALTIKAALKSYFKDRQFNFQLPLKPKGSTYQQKVWQALLALRPGETITYGELAKQLKTSPRAIGQACRTNPIVLFIPCHRVVGKKNDGGYMGQLKALTIKLDLLAHEASLS